jgi:hypothetical protein
MTDDNDRSSLPDVAKLAVAGIAVIAAVTGIVGSVTGGVARLARNTPWVLPTATILVFVAVALALAATMIGLVRPRPADNQESPEEESADQESPDQESADQESRWKDWGQVALVSVSLVGFGIAGTIVANELSNSLATPDRPVVSDAKWAPLGDGLWVLSGTAKASGLKTDDQLLVGVFGMVSNGRATPPSPRPTTVYTSPARPWWTPPDHYLYRGSLVYELTAGADIDGNVTVSFEVPLPDGYDGLQVVATLERDFGCGDRELNASPVEVPRFACLTLDAPANAAPTSTG